MEWKVLVASFWLVFLAEMGDKTQLAAMSLSAESGSPFSVLTGACLALITATILGVIFGSLLGHWIPHVIIKKVAGAIFLATGMLMIVGKF
jgi:putative Ca2+/H+ antiporter (TMEM165/GDT1 family)